MIPAFESTSLSNNWAPWLSLLLDFAIKGTAILLAAGLLVVVMRRASAAIRHLVLSLAIASLLALPALSLLLPAWRISIPSLPVVQSTNSSSGEQPLTAAAAATAEAEAKALAKSRSPEHSSSTIVEGLSPAAASKAGATELGRSNLDPAPTPLNWSALLLAIWLVGTLGVLVRLLIGSARVWWLARTATPLTEAPWADLAESLSKNLGLDRPVSLLTSKRVAMPLTCGALKPAVLMPTDTFDWSHNRKQVVLKHELAHVKRRDCLTQMLANMVCAFYWFNPAVWLAARQLRIERERACDDCVLESGTRPSEYADHLLDLARSFGSARCSTFAAVAIAKRSQLEGRLLAILDPTVSRLRPNRAKSLLIAIAVVGIALPLGAIKLTARANNSPQFEIPASNPQFAPRATLSYSAPGMQPFFSTQLPEPPHVDDVDDSPAAGDPADGGEAVDTPEPAGLNPAPDPSPSPSPSLAAAPQDEHEKARAIEALRNALKDEDAQVRHQAMAALIQLHDKSSGEEIKSALKDKDPQMRAQAAWALGIDGDDSAVGLLVAALQDENNQVRSQAAWALGLKGDKSAVEPLIAALKDADEHVRSQAAWSLGLKGDSRAGAALAAALQDQSNHVRSQAAWALGLKGDKSAVEALIAALKDRDEDVRSQAAWALGLKGDGRAVEALVAALRDSSNHVRSQAAWALGLKGDKRAADALNAAMKDSDQQVRRQAAWALGMILMKVGEARDSDKEKEDDRDNDDDDNDGAKVSTAVKVPSRAATRSSARIEQKLITTLHTHVEAVIAAEFKTQTEASAVRKSVSPGPPK